jgi:hypothetical protein
MARNDKEKLLSELLKGDLSGKEAEEALRILESDPEFRELLHELEQERERRKDDYWRQLRRAAHQLVDGMLEQRSADTERQSRHGLLTYDSSLLPLPQGVRPAAVETRRLKWTVGDFRVELACHPLSAASWELIGRIEGLSRRPLPTVRLQSEDRQYETDVDDFGVFRFERVPAGSYDVLIVLESRIAGSMSLSL